MKIKHWRRRMPSLVCGGLLACALAGCDLGGSSPDTGGIDDFFNANPYVSDPRLPGAPRDLVITPASGTISVVGDVIVFTVRGGEKPWHWGVANGNGTIVNLGEEGDQGVYTATAIGANTVIAFDGNGHAGLAEVTVAGVALSVTPTSATLTNVGDTATFTVNGGLPPYTWVVLNGGGGNVMPNTGPAVTYTRLAAGNNALTVTDGSASTFTVTISQP